MVFRRSEEKRADKRAREIEAQAEVDRLAALSAEALGAEILPVLAAAAAEPTAATVTVSEICRRLLGAVSGRANLALNLPVSEALQRLEHADLVLQMPAAETAPSWRITEEGEEAVTAGTIAKKLGLQAG